MPVELKYTKPGTTVADLDDAWQDRLVEADALFAVGHFAAAIADTIYALEIRLKVMICRKLDLPALPRAFEIHDLESLLVLAGLSQRLLASPLTVQNNWTVVTTWAEQINDFRYKPSRNWNSQKATAIISRIKDPPDGVMPWLSKQP